MSHSHLQTSSLMRVSYLHRHESTQCTVMMSTPFSCKVTKKKQQMNNVKQMRTKKGSMTMMYSAIILHIMTSQSN